VYLENNVRAAALAEYNYGAPEVFGSQSFLFVKVDEGVGMGILLGGKLYAGPRMAAGEFGQMVIAMQSTPAIGKAAYSLENLISNPAICERYAGHEVANINDTRSRVAKIAALASQGEGPAREALEETGRYLATGIANVVWGLDADVVVIDGAITDAWALLDPILRRHVTDSYRGAGLHVLIRPSALGGDAALIGAATLPLMTVFATEAPTRAIGAGV
jgi:predicted NBD/HSP70 family sugar kinase